MSESDRKINIERLISHGAPSDYEEVESIYFNRSRKEFRVTTVSGLSVAVKDWSNDNHSPTQLSDVKVKVDRRYDDRKIEYITGISDPARATFPDTVIALEADFQLKMLRVEPVVTMGTPPEPEPMTDEMLGIETRDQL